AGKSTLMKILSGYQPADSGDILIDGQAIAYVGPEAAIEHGIGMLQQDPLDVGAFTVVESFIYGAPGGLLLHRRKAAKHIEAANQRFGFELDPQAPIESLSIAQRQQLEIVRLLALGVRTLILDEPTTGISAEQKDALFSALRQLAHDEGMIVLLVSHKLEDVISLCDEVFVLRMGELVGEKEMPATPKELVALMFGAEIPPQPRESVEIGAPVLVLKNIHLRDKRLDMPNINLEVRAGEVIGLAGLDGSGQELFMRGCAGLERIHDGTLKLNGRPIQGRPYRQFFEQGLGFAASGRVEEGLIAGLTLTEHMALTLGEDTFVKWAAAKKHMQSQIAEYDIRGRADDNIEQLSGGNQQRVLMALLPPHLSVLILEQPTRGLDIESVRRIWGQLLRRRKSGTAILFSSAELDEIVTYSDRILVFYAGHIYEVPDTRQTSIEELGHLIGGEFDHSTGLIPAQE
ncbi:MAG: ATP-binding cassette domain-containing protein, partial [Anaerolineae bacterium]|nr:ATP-binding cassette domain-containing protein [Anaerolineae bacterium]